MEKEDGIKLIAKNMLEKGKPIYEIFEMTGLTKRKLSTVEMRFNKSGDSTIQFSGRLLSPYYFFFQHLSLS
jgi:hypothetical protein